MVHVSVPLREVYQGHFSSAGIKPSFRKNLNFYLLGFYHRTAG